MHLNPAVETQDVLISTVLFLFFSEFPQSEIEGLHQEGEKSAQAGPDQQLQTNDSAPVS